MNPNNLTLYHFDACPYCRRVRDYLDQVGLKIPMKDTMRDPAAREELRQFGGKTQVPALLIDDQMLYESRDIIAWLEENVVDYEPVSGNN